MAAGKAGLQPRTLIFFAMSCFIFLVEATVAVAPRKQAMRVVPDLNKITGCVHEALGHKKSCRQFAILARRPHDNGDAMALNPDFQRLFDGQAIFLVSFSRAIDAPDRNLSDR